MGFQFIFSYHIVLHALFWLFSFHSMLGCVCSVILLFFSDFHLRISCVWVHLHMIVSSVIPLLMAHGFTSEMRFNMFVICLFMIGFSGFTWFYPLFSSLLYTFFLICESLVESSFCGPCISVHALPLDGELAFCLENDFIFKKMT